MPALIDPLEWVTDEEDGGTAENVGTTGQTHRDGGGHADAPTQ